MAQCNEGCSLLGGSAYRRVRTPNGLKCRPYALTSEGLYGLNGVYRRGTNSAAPRGVTGLLPGVVNTPNRICCYG